MKLKSRFLFPLLLIVCSTGLAVLYLCSGYAHSSPENIRQFFPRFGFAIAFVATNYVWLQLSVGVIFVFIALLWVRSEPVFLKNILTFSLLMFQKTRNAYRFLYHHPVFQKIGVGLCSMVVALLLAELVLRLYFLGSDNVWNYNPAEMLSFVHEPQLKHEVYAAGHDQLQAHGYDSTWFDWVPPVRGYGHERQEVDLIKNEIEEGSYMQSIKVWNARFVYEAFHTDSFFSQQTQFSAYRGQRLYVFEPYDTTIYPVYRFFADAVLPGTPLRFNQFGFTGSDIAFEKPTQTIRIAFLGGSTTQQYPELSYAFTDYIELWLNAWAKRENLSVQFETINAGRVAQQSGDFAAIYKYELKPLQPDVVIYYEGRNQFVLEPLSLSRPSESFQKNLTYRLLSNSILLQYLLHFTGISYYDLLEWQKPATVFAALPAEQNPHPDAPDLPLRLPEIVRDLNSLVSTMDTAHQSLVLCSFAMQVADSLLSLAPYNLSYTYWLHDFLGYRTRDIARYHHFQNRVFKNYAASRSIPFIDVAAMLDTMPYAFSDGIHMNPHGIKLHALAVFKDLVPLLRQKINAGTLPYKVRVPYSTHPYITDSVRLVDLPK